MSPIELPFLYQTRTIFRCFSTSSKALRSHKAPAPNNPSEGPPESFLSQKAKESAAAEVPRRKGKASITRTEKEIFEAIFNDIKTSSGQTAKTNQSHNDTDPNAIFRLFLQEAGQRRDSAATSPDDEKSANHKIPGWNEHLKKYPPVLRHAAMKITHLEAGIDDSRDLISFEPSELTGSKRPTDRKMKDPRHGVYRPLMAALETETDRDADVKKGLQLRDFDATKEHEIAIGKFRGKTADYVEGELERISEELQSCIAPKTRSGAFKMWDICQKRILPMVWALDEKSLREKTSTDAAEAAVKPVRSKKEQNPEVPAKQVTTKLSPNSPSPRPTLPTPKLDLPPGVSSLAVITVLYPTLTLLALRNFTTHFPTTPFPLSLYTTLKTTSPQSRILGLNVHFYNTLLRHLWDIYSDFHALTSTLHEMQASGVDFDGETYAVIRQVEDERWNEVHGRAGTRGGQWWDRADQVRGWAEMVEWKGVVATRLQELGMGHLLAEREYSRDLLGAMGKEGVEGAGVWI